MYINSRKIYSTSGISSYQPGIEEIDKKDKKLRKGVGFVGGLLGS